MAQLNPYLVFNGNCEEAFTFYRSVFGGEFRTFSRFKDMPQMPPGAEFPENAKNRILHVSLPISNETILMGSDANPMMGDVPMGKNVSICVTAENKEEADRIFNALAAGGKITMPIADTFWGAYFGMLDDQYSIGWMISYDQPKSSMSQ